MICLQITAIATSGSECHTGFGTNSTGLFAALGPKSCFDSALGTWDSVRSFLRVFLTWVFHRHFQKKLLFAPWYKRSCETELLSIMFALRISVSYFRRYSDVLL